MQVAEGRDRFELRTANRTIIARRYQTCHFIFTHGVTDVYMIVPTQVNDLQTPQPRESSISWGEHEGFDMKL